MLFVFVLVCLSAPLINAAPVVSYNLVPPVFHTGVSPSIIAAPQPETPPAHPAVVENAIAESQLPQELLNPFYKNPAIAAGLAKESWFTNKEFPVHHREADRISREQIFKLVNNIRSSG